ncbi:MAG TPA: hypothetical protein VHM70_17425 [Polyangiaceae bacterium]|nr:hypothetical protein [Polyangiaceae bacterium]
MMILSDHFKDLNTAEAAFRRVQSDIEAVPTDQMAALNVDLGHAASVVLGAADRILTFRERILSLPEFDYDAINKLTDYALAAWYLYVTNPPEADLADAEAILSEMQALRAKLLTWAAVLAATGHFDKRVSEQINVEVGQKDAASDLFGLVRLYWARWDNVRGLCDLTKADLKRAAEVGLLSFAIASRRDGLADPWDAHLRVRRAWTLVDRSYSECRRALHYLRFQEGDCDEIAPNLRGNSGNRSVHRRGASRLPD